MPTDRESRLDVRAKFVRITGPFCCWLAVGLLWSGFPARQLPGGEFPVVREASSSAQSATTSRDDEPENCCPPDWLTPHSCPGDSCFELAGWLGQGFTFNPHGPRDRFNGPVTQNDRANEYQLNQIYLIASIPTDVESDRLGLGFQADVLYGTDAVFFQARGLDDRIVSDGTSRFYKLAVPQLYLELFAPIGSGVTFQIGKWYTLVGYESGLVPEDFFYSRTISFIGTPYTHTGVLATFDVNDRISMSHGIHRGNDVWDDNNNAWSYGGGVTWTSEEETSIVTFAISTGPEQDEEGQWHDIDGSAGPDAPGESLNRTVYSLSFEQQLCERLQYVLVHDYFFQDGSQRFGIEDAEAYGISQYLIYEVSDRLAAGLRLEIYRDDDGFVASGCRSENPSSPGVYTNLTMALQFRPRERLLIRPEVRWDWQDRDDPRAPAAFDDGTSSHQFLFSLDVVAAF